MIVKILSAAASFSGVSYNTTKVEKNKGELMKVANFGPLQALGVLRPEDYVNYLKMISARNKGVKEPQFHAAISTKGKTHDKQELTAIAVEWLGLMGYREQPYLIVFHKDTGHNHVHLVSTRIDRNGKKISSAFEHNRAIQNLNKVLGLDEQFTTKQDLDKALTYQFGTKAQFMMVLESMGYKLKELDGILDVIKFGKQLDSVPLTIVNEKARQYQPDLNRRAQLMAVFHKYSQIHSTSLYEQDTILPGRISHLPGKFSSDFASYLQDKMGLQILFHSKVGKLPYGYSIVDHASKTVWKGGEIMPLAKLLAVEVAGALADESSEVMTFIPATQVSGEVKEYYGTLLKAAQYNYSDLQQGLTAQEFALTENQDGLLLTDIPMHLTMPADALLSLEELRNLKESHRASTSAPIYVPPISIADDVDDQQIHGMRRRRQRKARTNTR